MVRAHTGMDAKAQFKPLSEVDIQSYTDDASFQKGFSYYLNHTIVEPILSESVLRAYCRGSSGGPYRVEATLVPAGEKSTHKLTSADCNCPRGGFCKHLVALLLTWLHHPEHFAVHSGIVGRLSEKYSIYGRPQQALKIELARFQAGSDTTTYRAVRSAAQIAGQPEDAWSNLRPRLIQTLEQQSRWGELVSIYLDEGEVGHALSALAEMERGSGRSLPGYGHSYYSVPGDYRIQVAKAAEEDYPGEAIRLYKSVIQKLIDGRGRENYQQAIGYMMRIRMLYQKQGQEPEWHAFITNLRNSNKSLRALKEELDKREL